MSTGRGSTQRAVLTYLTHAREVGRRLGGSGWLPVATLARLVYDTDDRPASRAQVESVRRAVKRLNAEGLAELSASERGELLAQLRPSVGPVSSPASINTWIES